MRVPAPSGRWEASLAGGLASPLEISIFRGLSSSHPSVHGHRSCPRGPCVRPSHHAAGALWAALSAPGPGLLGNEPLGPAGGPGCDCGNAPLVSVTAAEPQEEVLPEAGAAAEAGEWWGLRPVRARLGWEHWEQNGGASPRARPLVKVSLVEALSGQVGADFLLPGHTAPLRNVQSQTLTSSQLAGIGALPGGTVVSGCVCAPRPLRLPWTVASLCRGKRAGPWGTPRAGTALGRRASPSPGTMICAQEWPTPLQPGFQA